MRNPRLMSKGYYLGKGLALGGIIFVGLAALIYMKSFFKASEAFLGQFNCVKQQIETLPQSNGSDFNPASCINLEEIGRLFSGKDVQLSGYLGAVGAASVFAGGILIYGRSLVMAGNTYNNSGAKIYGFAPESTGSNIVAGENVKGNKIVGTQHNLASEPRQNLAEAAAEIQQLLKQLEETYSQATAAEKQSALAITLQQKIQQNPSFKTRLRKALKEGGIEALKVLFAPIGIPLEMVRGWIEAE